MRLAGPPESFPLDRRVLNLANLSATIAITANLLFDLAMDRPAEAAEELIKKAFPPFETWGIEAVERAPIKVERGKDRMKFTAPEAVSTAGAHPASVVTSQLSEMLVPGSLWLK